MGNGSESLDGNGNDVGNGNAVRELGWMGNWNRPIPAYQVGSWGGCPFSLINEVQRYTTVAV